MQRDIIELIDTLVKMAGSISNYETLSGELDEIKKQISKKETKLQDLKESMVDDKYFDASGEVVDRNIEISITKKIKRLNRMADNIRDDMKLATDEEATLHDEIKKLKKELDASSKYIDVIEERILNTASSEIKENYQELLTIERNNYSAIEIKLIDKKTLYEKIEKQIECLSTALNELQDTIKQEKEKLAETKANLANPKTYIDENLRKEDEDKLAKLIEEIDELDKRRLSILTDPVLIANDVKELVANDDKDNSLIKLKELITLVKSKPYMNEHDINVLNEKLANLENELETLTKEFSNKNYNGQDSSLIEERINYLQNIIELAKINIDQIRENITIIDTQRVAFIKNKITNAENTAKEIEKSIVEYHALVNASDKKSEKEKSALKATYNKKLKELDTVREIVGAYKEDLRALIKEAFDLENIEIAAIKETIKEQEAEIAKLNKLMVLNSKTKDIIEQEKDQTKLKDIKEEIKNIKFRLSFDKNPDEIYDNIEMILGSIGFVENKRSSKLRTEKFTFERINKEEPKFESVITEEHKIEEPTPILETVTTNPVIEEKTEELPIFEGYQNLTNNSNRFKVVEIIPLDNKEEAPQEVEKENDFMVNNFEDTGYISFEDAYASSNGGN